MTIAAILLLQQVMRSSSRRREEEERARPLSSYANLKEKRARTSGWSGESAEYNKLLSRFEPPPFNVANVRYGVMRMTDEEMEKFFEDNPVRGSTYQSKKCNCGPDCDWEAK